MNEIINHIRSEWQRLTAFEKGFGAVVVTIMFILFTGQTIYSAAISGTNVAAPVVPFDTADTYPTHNARYGKGGLVQYQTTSQCRTIPIQRRYSGLTCYAATTDTWRYLKNGTANTNWAPAPFGVAGTDGRTIPAIYINISSSGGQSFTWDKDGLNPSPAPPVYKALFEENGSRTTTRNMTPIRDRWQATGHLTGATGNTTTNTFTPGILSRYSTGHSTKLEVQATYSATAYWGGKRIITARINPACNRVGGTGQQGIPGSDATVTVAAVVSAFATETSDKPIVLRTTSGTKSKLEVWDTSNAIRTWFDTQGNQYWQTAAEEVVVKILTDGSFVVMRGGVNRFEVLNDSSFAQYHTDGTTKGFRCYSTGVCYGSEGLPSTTGLCITRHPTTGVVSYITCGSAGGGWEHISHGGGNLDSNVAAGISALAGNTTGTVNTAIGAFSLQSNTIGQYNTGIGHSALESMISGINNTALGVGAGAQVSGASAKTSGNYGLYLGDFSKAGANGTSNEIVIGSGAVGAGSNTTTIGNDNTVTTIIRGSLVIK